MVGTPSLTLAFVAGFISFVSPCCLPLVPGYLATVTGTAPTEARRRVDRRLISRSLVFVSTFSLVFILLGLGATALGAFLASSRTTLNDVAGGVMIAMGVFFIASLFVLRLNRDFRFNGLAARASGGGPVIAGAAFALAWTPCVGPTLGAILGLASTSSGTGEAALLLAIYSAGLAVPFLFAALAFNAATRAFAIFNRHHAAIQVIGGFVLVAMGALVLSGQLFRLNIEAQRLLDGFGLNFFQTI